MTMYRHEVDEWRREVASMSEAERARNCGHTNRTHGVCPDCGDVADE